MKPLVSKKNWLSECLYCSGFQTGISDASNEASKETETFAFIFLKLEFQSLNRSVPQNEFLFNDVNVFASSI